MRRAALILLLLVFTLPDTGAQDFHVMFYNTENLFDTLDDTLRDDDEFLPPGTRRWTNARYWKKLDAMARVIAAAGGWETPVIAGLCEIENRQVAEDLAGRPLLQAAGYRVVHRESPDQRGIDVCLFYRHNYARVLTVRSWVPAGDSTTLFTSRNLLYVKMLVYGDTIHFIVCHWPSRRGGSLAASSVREQVASLLRYKTDSLTTADKGVNLIIMGDFNTSPAEVTDHLPGSSIVNLSTMEAARGKGSYRYQGSWEMIDQILVSDSFIREGSHFSATHEDYSVCELSFLLEDDPEYPGKRPLSVYRGFRWSEGYSDHLPVVLRIRHY